jgi:hypothetical protein
VILLHTLGTSVDELTSEETLDSDEILSTVLVLVGISEDNLGERSATTSVVHNFLDDSLDVPIIENEKANVLTLLFRRSQGF